MTKNFIFDFDGTIVDSFNTVIEKFNLLADEFGFNKVQHHEIESLRDITSKEFINYFQIPLLKIPSVIEKVRALIRSRMHTLTPFTDLPHVLQELAKQQVTLGILTSNSQENVMDWLSQNQLQHLFTFVQGGTDFFGKDKILKKMLKTHQLDKTKTFYIGDETRDIDAANKCGISSIAVTWGFNSEKALSQHRPTYIARIPKDIINISKLL